MLEPSSRCSGCGCQQHKAQQIKTSPPFPAAVLPAPLRERHHRPSQGWTDVMQVDQRRMVDPPKLAGQHQRRLAVHVAPVQQTRHTPRVQLAARLLARHLICRHQQLQVIQPTLGRRQVRRRAAIADGQSRRCQLGVLRKRLRSAPGDRYQPAVPSCSGPAVRRPSASSHVAALRLVNKCIATASADRGCRKHRTPLLCEAWVSATSFVPLVRSATRHAEYWQITLDSQTGSRGAVDLFLTSFASAAVRCCLRLDNLKKCDV